MAVTKEITYFNSFLVKKVIQKTGASTGYPDVSKKQQLGHLFLGIQRGIRCSLYLLTLIIVQTLLVGI